MWKIFSLAAACLLSIIVLVFVFHASAAGSVSHRHGYPRVEVAVVDDITNITGVDAIVNPANPWLLGPWGGLNAVIWNAAGVLKIYKATRAIRMGFPEAGITNGRLPVGQAVITKSYNIADRGGAKCNPFTYQSAAVKHQSVFRHNPHRGTGHAHGDKTARSDPPAARVLQELVGCAREE
jgi:hypothetical protein